MYNLLYLAYYDGPKHWVEALNCKHKIALDDLNAVKIDQSIILFIYHCRMEVTKHD